MNFSSIFSKAMVLLVLMSTGIAMAQQPLQYTQYMYNTTVLNSGYTGTNGKLEATLLHRSQWVGIDGAPTGQSFTIQGTSGEKIGLGISAINDKLGASSNLILNGNFAYKLPLSAKTTISLGLNAGLDFLNIDWSKGTFANPGDPIFQENNNTVRPVLGAGAFMYTNTWYVGLSTQNLFNSRLYNDRDAMVTDRKSQYYVMAGYVFEFSETIKMKPTILTKHTAGAPITFDVSVNALVNDKFNLGLAYRYDDAMSALAGFYVSKQIFVGYAYDFTITELGDYNSGSHEIIFKYSVFNGQKRALSPRFF